MKTEPAILTQLNVRIDRKLKERLLIFCIQRGIKIEETVPIAIAEYMENAQKTTDENKKGKNSKSESLI